MAPPAQVTPFALKSILEKDKLNGTKLFGTIKEKYWSQETPKGAPSWAQDTWVPPLWHAMVGCPHLVEGNMP